ncbi:DUF3243 domain-containing protein [Jeotgalibacillus proteolyticus]|uniref:DUF3243 domain-containing protein n=1 Tax=Jeotgalibacillus proteolyticus TaxID=2082395 RepID=A0A2S5GCF2_9BACL|nr:DUF3243 domain-containing protein [Jeotgalibacillus proteolyticus]PPA70717.1 DUF3243 domain-containing protein [Jeotgalibacillus proteolyticus]
MSIENKVENEMQQTDNQKKEEILQSFDRFKNYLGDQVSKGEKMGLGEESLAKGAEKVADYLAKHEEPRNSEEKLLQELWKVGDKDQQHHLAHMLVRMAQNTN